MKPTYRLPRFSQTFLRWCSPIIEEGWVGPVVVIGLNHKPIAYIRDASPTVSAQKL